MNHEAKRLRIRQLIREVNGETMAVHASGGVDPNTSAHDALMAKLARWEASMNRMEKLMKSDLHFARVRNARRGRRPSYAQRQRVASAEANYAGLRTEMARLASAITRLIEAMSPEGMPWKRIAEALENIAKGGGDSLSLDGTQNRELVQVIRQHEPGGAAPGVPPHVLGTNLLTLCVALFAILKRMRSGS
ncbi:MAG: hypothetical protein AAFR47_09230 [Pseudomonadota bacterium]